MHLAGAEIVLHEREEREEYRLAGLGEIVICQPLPANCRKRVVLEAWKAVDIALCLREAEDNGVDGATKSPQDPIL